MFFAFIRLPALLAVLSPLALASLALAEPQAPPVDETPLPIEIERAFPRLKFKRPILLTHAGDGTNRVFVPSQLGKVHVLPNDQDAEQAEVFLDIEDRVVYKDRENEEGLLGLAFHPKYEENGELFIYYTTTDAPNTSVISRFRVSPDNPNRADPASEEELLRIPQPFWNHNGGTIVFGPDGYLYIGLGDGGRANDPPGHGQNLQTLLGSILRIDVDRKTPAGDERPALNYAIPQDNPFVNRGERARPEIWAYGLRNVWRMAFDRETGKLWAADVGQDLWEEINLIERGGNYGWNLREGKHPFGPKGSGPREDLIDPIWEYDHKTGKSITGGMVYRGTRVPELVGRYLYADYVTGKLWALKYDEASQRVAANSPISGNTMPVLSFGEDEEGEVYFCTDVGTLHRFRSVGSWPQFRGPSGMGHSQARNVPLEWSDTKNVAWRREIPGRGWSSPVLAGGRLYLTTAVEIKDSPDSDLSLRVLCLEAERGELVWETEVFVQDGSTAPRIHAKNSHASPTPLVDAGHVFVHFGHQGTACLDLEGKVQWRERIEYEPVHGNGGSPILAGDRLVVSCDGASQQWVLALDRRSGKQLWRAERNSGASRQFSFSTPLLITAGGRQQVVSPGSDAVCAYDPASGEEIWRVTYSGYSVIPRPVYGHGMVFLSTGYDSPSVLAIRADGQGDVTETHVAWRMSKGAPHSPSLLLAGDELFMVSDRGIATCVDARTGEVHWQERVGGNYSASPILAEGRVYLQNEEGTGTVLAAGKQFRQLAVNPLNERTLASYAVADGALFIRTEKGLYRIGQ